MSATFQRNEEDFTCERCQTVVEGDGYTNHCPECLWSKHVDIYPGDRAATCRGLMRPIEIYEQGGTFLVFHKCEACGYIKKNRLSRNDNMETVIKIATATAESPQR